MPRARINAPEEDVVLTKPRTRKPRVVDADDGRTAPTPRKRAPAKPRAVKLAPEPEPIRKAPTPLSARRRRHSQKSKSLLVVTGLCLLLSGLGIGIGYMDEGSIDVVAVVNERNEKINKGEVRDEAGNTITKTIDVQNGDTRPNGGLPMGDPIAPPASPILETSTSTESASSTESAATSTEPTTEVASTTEEST